MRLSKQETGCTLSEEIAKQHLDCFNCGSKCEVEWHIVDEDMSAIFCPFCGDEIIMTEDEEELYILEDDELDDTGE